MDAALKDFEYFEKEKKCLTKIAIVDSRLGSGTKLNSRYLCFDFGICVLLINIFKEDFK